MLTHACLLLLLLPTPYNLTPVECSMCCSLLADNPAILQQAAATQLLMVQEPVPVELLLAEGVLECLLELASQLATCFTEEPHPESLKVPASCMDQVTGCITFSKAHGLTLGDLVRILMVCIVCPCSVIAAVVARLQLRVAAGVASG
jgi:hypothetical protein